jgi:hypothetical protein
MPRIPPAKRAALDILDRLFFNQTCIFSLSERLFAEDSHAQALAILMTIRRRLDEEILTSGESGVAAEALRHTVYCLLEVRLEDNLSDDRASSVADHLGLTDHQGVPLATRAKALDPVAAASMHEHTQNFFQGVIVTIAKHAHGVCTNTALAIASKIDTEEIRKAPAVARNRLSERVFSLDFNNAPVMFLSWMHRIGVLKSKKFACHWATSEIPVEFKTRVGLLCDFILTRRVVTHLMKRTSDAPMIANRLRNDLNKQLSDQAWMQLQDLCYFIDRRSRYQGQRADTALLKALYEKSFDFARIDDGDYLTSYLDYFAQNEMRCRFWNGPQHSWIGVVGAGMVHGYHILVDPKCKITRNGNNYSKRDPSVNCEETVTDNVSKTLKKYGMDSRPGSLYETYKGSYLRRPAGLRDRARRYHAALDKMDLAFPAASFEDFIYLATVVETAP